MTRAHLSTDRATEFELMRVLDDGSYVLKPDEDAPLVFEVSSIRERVEVRCDYCGRWSVDAAPD